MSYMNTSGYEPLDLRVLVMPDVVPEKTGSIFVPETARERDQFAQCEGVLVAAGVNAFSEARQSADFVPPKPGDRIIFAKYGGIMLDGKDGQKYRIMNDADITALIIDAAPKLEVVNG